MKAARIDFYFDRDIRGVGMLLASINSRITFPGASAEVVRKRLRPACPIPEGPVPDEVWIPETARRGWLAITRDGHIKSRPAEKTAVIDHGARLVALASGDAGTKWAQLEVLMTRWRDLEGLLARPGPFIVTMSRTGKLGDVL